jgi:preprotein translocase subunit SecE
MATQWFEKAQRQAAAKKAANANKPKKTLKSFFQGIGRFFREIRSEWKKIVWPSKKDIIKNTVMVLATSVVTGVVIWLIDSVLSLVVVTFLGGV